MLPLPPVPLRPVVVYLAMLAIAGAGRAGEETPHPLAGKTVGELSWEFGLHPERCFSLPEADGFEGACEWLVYDRLVTWEGLAERFGQEGDFWLLCRFSTAGDDRTVTRCQSWSRERRIDIYPDRPRTVRRRGFGVELVSEKELKEEAVAGMQAARTISDLVDLIGGVPEECLRLPDGGLVCQWPVLRDRPGWRTIARWGDMPSKNFRLVCRFPSATGPRGEDSCKVSLID